MVLISWAVAAAESASVFDMPPGPATGSRAHSSTPLAGRPCLPRQATSLTSSPALCMLASLSRPHYTFTCRTTASCSPRSCGHSLPRTTTRCSPFRWAAGATKGRVARKYLLLLLLLVLLRQHPCALPGPYQPNSGRCPAPRAHAQVLSRLLARAQLPSAVTMNMGQNLTSFEDSLVSVGSCYQLVPAHILL